MVTLLENKPGIYEPMDIKKELSYESKWDTGYELIQSVHFKIVQGENGTVITVKKPDGVICDIPFGLGTIFKPYMIDAAMDIGLGSVAEWRECREEHLEVKLKARVALKLYLLKWWEEIGIESEPMTVGVYQDIMFHFMPGFLAASTGIIEI